MSHSLRFRGDSKQRDHRCPNDDNVKTTYLQAPSVDCEPTRLMHVGTMRRITSQYQQESKPRIKAMLVETTKLRATAQVGRGTKQEDTRCLAPA
jgi:hypothetical protein